MANINTDEVESREGCAAIILLIATFLVVTAIFAPIAQRFLPDTLTYETTMPSEWVSILECSVTTEESQLAQDTIIAVANPEHFDDCVATLSFACANGVSDLSCVGTLNRIVEFEDGSRALLATEVPSTGTNAGIMLQLFGEFYRYEYGEMGTSGKYGVVMHKVEGHLPLGAYFFPGPVAGFVSAILAVILLGIYFMYASPIPED